MWLLYHFVLYLFSLAVRISSLWDRKSFEWLEGRKNWKWSLKNIPKKENTRIWFHVASLGEFEQAKPVIETLKKERPELEIILSFFSPSGYNVRSHYQLAQVIYLPLDLPGNAEVFLDAIQPDLAVFVKYDLWPGYLKALEEKNIPAILISAFWAPNRRWSSGSIRLTKKYLRNFRHIFMQRKDHLQHFQQQGFSNLSVAGDTRIDRSLLLPFEIEKRLPKIFDEESTFDIIAGSTWSEDEDLLIPVIKEMNLRAIIVPHDVSLHHINKLVSKMTVPFKLYSNVEQDNIPYQVLIIDCIGLLSVLYSAGKIAYVGGGFGKGIHNILEPAAHKCPVIFGPAHERFPEAHDLIQIGAAWSITNKDQLKDSLQYLMADDNAMKSGEKAFNYLIANQGATEIVTDYILESIPYAVSE